MSTAAPSIVTTWHVFLLPCLEDSFYSLGFSHSKIHPDPLNVLLLWSSILNDVKRLWDEHPFFIFLHPYLFECEPRKQNKLKTWVQTCGSIWQSGAWEKISTKNQFGFFFGGEGFFVLNYSSGGSQMKSLKLGKHGSLSCIQFSHTYPSPQPWAWELSMPLHAFIPAVSMTGTLYPPQVCLWTCPTFLHSMCTPPSRSLPGFSQPSWHTLALKVQPILVPLIWNWITT